MSTIKQNSSHNTSASKSHNGPKNSALKTDKGKEAPQGHGKEQKSEKKDAFSASKELDETKKARDAKDTGKGAPKSEDGKDQDSLLKRISDLQQQLDDMKKKKPEEPENLGGCCGKSHGSKKSDDPNQKDDPDSELTKLAVAVLRGGQPPQPGGGAKASEADKNAAKALSANPTQLKAQLSQKYQQYKQQGVQLRPETEQLVESALKGGSEPPSSNPKPGPQTTNSKQSNPNPPRPLQKAS